MCFKTQVLVFQLFTLEFNTNLFGLLMKINNFNLD